MSARVRSSPVYIYGLVRADLEVDLGSIGLEQQGAPARVYTLRAGSVAAVVSARKGQSTVLPLRRDLLAHERVIARAMEVGTIVPFAFGQVARNEREVLRLLSAREASVSRELDRLEGKVQMGLKVQWEVENIFQYLVDADPELADFRARLFAMSTPPSLAGRIELGQLFEQRLQSERARLVDSIVSALPVDGAAAKALPVGGEKAVADLTFLINRSERSRFEDAVRQLAAAWSAEYAFSLTGPWAPYNFVELQLSSSRNEGEESAS